MSSAWYKEIYRETECIWNKFFGDFDFAVFKFVSNLTFILSNEGCLVEDWVVAIQNINDQDK